jgi:phosphoserine phosphatase RsbU/P
VALGTIKSADVVDAALEPVALPVGVLVDTLEEDYQARVVLGACDEAATLGLSTVCFVGGQLAAPDRLNRQQNLAYTLCEPTRLSGAVILAGALSSACGLETLERELAPLEVVTRCSIGGALRGAVHIGVDIQPGLSEAMRLLVNVRNRRRVAFIQGPPGNPEAQARLAVYSALVRELKLPDDLVVPGDFGFASGAAAVEVLLDKRRQGFDAIIACNDLMALGAIEALRARGVPVPDRVAVVGFDDIEAARYALPSLSTVRQPLYEQGRRAVQEVVARLSEPSLPTAVLLRASYIGRESCGALTLSAFVEGLSTQRGPDLDLSELDFTQALARSRSELRLRLEQMLRQAGVPHEPSLPDRLVGLAAAELEGRGRGLLQSEGFTACLEQAAQSEAGNVVDTQTWQSVISTLRAHFGACLQREPRMRRAAEDLWHQARVLIGGLGERAQARRWLEGLASSNTLRHVHGQILDAPSLPELSERLREALHAVGIERGFVALDQGNASYRGVCAIDPRGVHVTFHGTFGAKRPWPEAWQHAGEPRAWILQTLAHHGLSFGYVVMQHGPRQGRIYASLRDALAASPALQAACSANLPG